VRRHREPDSEGDNGLGWGIAIEIWIEVWKLCESREHVDSMPSPWCAAWRMRAEFEECDWRLPEMARMFMEKTSTLFMGRPPRCTSGSLIGGSDRIHVEPAQRGDRLTHLLQVLAATWASAQVCLQARALERRQRILRVVRYELYQVMAGKFV
jgi:hypothetical protein